MEHLKRMIYRKKRFQKVFTNMGKTFLSIYNLQSRPELIGLSQWCTTFSLLPAALQEF